MNEHPVDVPQDGPEDPDEGATEGTESVEGMEAETIETVDPDEATAPAMADEPAATGHPAVDEVLRSLEDLDSRPVDEHVAVFEEAHDALRRALASAGDDQD